MKVTHPITSISPAMDITLHLLGYLPRAVGDEDDPLATDPEGVAIVERLLTAARVLDAAYYLNCAPMEVISRLEGEFESAEHAVILLIARLTGNTGTDMLVKG